MNFSLYKSQQKLEIIDLFQNTFSDSEGSEEGTVIGKLVSDFLSNSLQKDDLFVFVACDDHQRVVGSILFSKLSFPNEENVYLLAPVAVATKWHGQGIGQALIRFGLETLKEKDISHVITYGDIRFYSKVGFTAINEEMIQAPLTLSYPEGWLAQSLTGQAITPISGKPTCLEAIANPVYW
ncbi:GNAT family N-acetyltransferase [Vibrio tarriae]|uniref:GNAT family N-acetyltransferase n=1 Tax=Vibrio tarriae TaxID=2014742 RepID=UPI000DE4D191|nr:N-acetyltransferase [Vibrio tarriae]QEO46966.1 N-acetyltransferase [Vibrio cholerae]RBM35671.1 GNAT family N-acetyltransferase [Vibrio tarriae]RBM42628.1 GNAT family N-acetyltransferase [Vibrio tarriae]RBM55334.1 GNAT family N-acetyltransferase [Vibrio tarriae]